MSLPHVLDRDRALARLLELLSISAPTGEERPVAERIVSELRAHGVPASSIRIDDAAERIPLPSTTGNVIVDLGGSLPGPRRVLSAHMDTVPLARGARPVVEGGRVRPRGETALGGDDRAGVAAVLTAAIELLAGKRPHPPLTLLFTVREESGLWGARFVKVPELGGAELAFNFDGGSPAEVTIAATGAARMDIDIRGIAAHAGVHPERGVSAATIFADAAAALDRDGWLGLVNKGALSGPSGGSSGSTARGSSKGLFTGTSNIGVLQGGDATNVVMDQLRVRAEARSHDPAFLERILAAYRAELERAAGSHRSESGEEGSVSIDVELSYHPFRLEESSPVVLAGLAAVRSAGLEPRLKTSNGGLDANWLTRNGLPTATFGVGQHEIHTVAEYVEIEEFWKGCELALALALG